MKESDVPLWERCEAYAKRRRLPMSALITTALERYLARQGEQPR